MINTTLDAETLESFRHNNFASIKDNCSVFIAKYLAKRGILSLEQFAQRPVLDFADYRLDILTATDLVGIEYLGSYLQELYFPLNVQVADRVNIASKVNLTDMPNLKKVYQNDKNYQAFCGNLSKNTLLEEFLVTIDTSNKNWVLPILNNNPNLKIVSLNGNGLSDLHVYLGTDNVGLFTNCTQLQRFELTNLQATNKDKTQLVIDKALESLKILKQNGAPIKTIDFSSSPAPTLGTSDPNYSYLKDFNNVNGFKITLGTF